MVEPASGVRGRSVSVTPLIGAGTYGGGPRSCLLKLGSVRILVDCGWDSQFKEATLKLLLAACSDKAAPVDLVLLSFGDLEHCGALPVLIGQLGLRVPIYCTAPTLALGYQALYEAHECQPSDTSTATPQRTSALAAVASDASASSSSGSNEQSGAGASSSGAAAAASSSTSRPVGVESLGFSLDDVDAAFAPMTRSSTANHGRPYGCKALKYNEPLVLKGLDLTITPVNSGRCLGGCLWRLKWQTDEILYACDMNPLGGELIMNRAALPAPSSQVGGGGSGGAVSGGAAAASGAASSSSSGSGPALLITDATNWGRSLKPLSQRMQDLKDSILSTVRRGGNVLLPTDAAGRVLELLLFLDRLWNTEPGLAQGVRLALVHPMAENVVRLARSMLEWMSDEVASSFDPQKRHPLSLRHVRIVHSTSDLFSAANNNNGARDRLPWVVLATHSSLELGPARDLLTKWAEHPTNKVVFTSRAAPGTLGAKLQRFNERPLVASVTVPVKRPLAGEDLVAWEAAKASAEAEARREADTQRFIAELQGSSASVSSSSSSAAGAAPAVVGSASEASSSNDHSSAATVAGADGGSAAAMMMTSPTNKALSEGLDDKQSSPSTPRSNNRKERSGSGSKGARRQEEASLDLVSTSAQKKKQRGALKNKRRKTTGSSFLFYAAPRHPMLTSYEPTNDASTDSVYGASLPPDLLAHLRSFRSGTNSGNSSSSASLGGDLNGRTVRDRMLSNSGLGRSGVGDSGMDSAMPFKWVKEPQALTVRCETPLIDLEGRPDGAALKHVLGNLKPRRLLVAYGPTPASLELRQHGERVLGLAAATTGSTATAASSPAAVSASGSNGKYPTEGASPTLLRRCWAPAGGQTVAFELDARSYDLALSDAVLAQVVLAPVLKNDRPTDVASAGGGGGSSSSASSSSEAWSGVSLAHVRGWLRRATKEHHAAMGLLTHRAHTAPRLVLDASPADSSSSSSSLSSNQRAGHCPLLVGASEAKIVSLKKWLDADVSLQVELQGRGKEQRLAVKSLETSAGAADNDADSVVVVRLGAGTGQLLLEGPLCSAYFKVRNAIYATLTIV